MHLARDTCCGRRYTCCLSSNSTGVRSLHEDSMRAIARKLVPHVACVCGHASNYFCHDLPSDLYTGWVHPV